MKLNIHMKVLILVLGAGLTAFIVLGIFSFLGYRVVQRDMQDMSQELSENSASYIDNLIKENVKNTLGSLAIAKAQFIDRQMAAVRENAEILANAMTQIFSHPENYPQESLPDPRFDPIRNNEPYRIYAPDIRNNVTPDIEREFALAANIKYLLADLAKTYKDCDATAFVGGEKGWYICTRLVTDSTGKTDFNSIIPFSEERIYKFDPRKRPWYISAKNANAPVISDSYRAVDTGNYQQIGASAPFYDANGNLVGICGLDASSEDIYKEINKATAGKDSFNFVINDNGKIIFASDDNGKFSADTTSNFISYLGIDEDLRNNPEKTIVDAANKMISGENGVLLINFNENRFYLAFAPLEETGWSFGMIIPEKDIIAVLNDSDKYFQGQIDKLQAKMLGEHYYMDYLVVLVPISLLITLFFLSMNLSRRFVKPIHALADGVRDIASGNMDKKLDIRTGDEIEHLAICFNAMTDELKTYMANFTKVTAEKERIATELDVATDIQRGMLPKDFPDRPDCQIFATMTPAKEVGGDFYDFYFLDDKNLAITVADVSGKGISAALFMVVSKTILNNFAQSFYNQNGLAPVVSASNEQLCATNDAMMFVTAFVGVLNLESGEFIYVNAGHNPPVIYRAENNHCDFLDVDKNFVLGPMDGISFTEQKISLKNGDLLFLYTDGVTEALNIANEEYLPDRLINFMNSTDCKADLQTLLESIRGDLAKHVGDADQSDDITMFALRFTGKI